MRRVTLVALAAVGLTACGGGQAAPNTSPTKATDAAPATTATVPPPTTTTAPPPTYPPTSYRQAQALAATGNTDGFQQFKYRSNGMASCPNMGYFVTVPSSLTGQSLAAALLAFYFQTAQNHPNTEGCGGLDIDAYYSQSQASSNSATAGGATAGNVSLLIDSSMKYQVFVDVGSVTGPSAVFNFTYRP